MGVRELDLVQDYTGHFADMVLGVYYAKARMYDAGDRRFMATDPVRGNVTEPKTMIPYVYVVNNPIRFIDPTGEYYIVQNGTVKVLSYKVAGYNDPSGLDYGDIYDVVTEFVPDGTYSVVPETHFTAFGKSLFELFEPFEFMSDAVYKYLDKVTHVVGGNSAYGFDSIGAVITIAGFAINLNVTQKTLDKVANGAGTILGEIVGKVGFLYGLVQANEREKVRKGDEVLFNIIEKNNISMTLSSLESLAQIMFDATYYLEAMPDYFFNGTDVFGCTFFSVDWNISTANDPVAKIEAYLNEYKKYLQKTYTFTYLSAKKFGITKQESLIQEMREVLENYKARVEQVENDLKAILTNLSK